jgi:ABC-2 type transport system ATP-binding protein
VPEGLDALPGVHDVSVEGARVRLEVDNDQLDAVLRRLVAAGVRGLVSRPPTLEELFLRHYEVEPADASAVPAATGSP